MPKKLPSIERLRYLFSYDSESGLITRRVSVKGRHVNALVGTINDKGYVVVTVDGTSVRGHVLAWAMFYGEYPEFELDHKDRIRSNNAISNLRPATRSQQLQNRDFTKYNTSGATGGYQLPSGRWRARIGLKKEYIHLGYFDTMEEAETAYIKARNKLFGDFAYVSL